MKVAVEYIKWLQEERKKINTIPLEEIEFFEDGMKIQFNPQAIQNFDFTGLNNVDFITSGYYQEAKIREIKITKG